MKELMLGQDPDTGCKHMLSATAVSQVSQPAGPPGFEAEPLMCPPQLFSKQDVPVDYAFRSYYGSDPDRFKAGTWQVTAWAQRSRMSLEVAIVHCTGSDCDTFPACFSFAKDRRSGFWCAHSKNLWGQQIVH